MFIIFLNSHKKTRKFINSLSKEERRRMEYFLVSDYDGEDIGDLIPKKANCTILAELIPPQPLVLKRVMDKISKKEFQEEYYRYLTRPKCRAALVSIVAKALFDNSDVVVSFGLNELDMGVDRYVMNTLEEMFPDLTLFTFAEWRDCPHKVINYSPDNIGTMCMQVREYADTVERKIRELNMCKDGYDRHAFYDEEDD